jgi:hypothetical protein
MTTLRLWQHIYGNVEREDSPRRQGGFQTLFCSRDRLSERDVESWESRFLLKRDPTAPQRSKRLFFTTDTDLAVVAQVTAIEQPDRAGRGGRVVAHALVGDLRELQGHVGCLLHVLRDYPFVTSIHQALELGDRRTGDIASVELPLPATEPDQIVDVPDWPVAELRHLILLALQAQQRRAERSIVALIGTPQQVDRAIATALLAVPDRLLPQCSFDTYFYGGNPTSDYFWAVGLPEAPGSSRYTCFDARTLRRISGSPPAPETSYQRWLMPRLQPDSVHALAQIKEVAFRLGEWLDGRLEDPFPRCPPPLELTRSMLQDAPARVAKQIQTQLRRQLPPEIAARVYRRIWPGTIDRTLLEGLFVGFTPAWLLERLLESYQEDQFRRPSQQEVRIVGRLLRQYPHPRWQLVYACWTNQMDLLRDGLDELDDTAYREFLQVAFRFRLAPPAELFSQGRGEMLTCLLGADGGCTEFSLADLVQRILEHRETRCLGRLIPCIQGQPLVELARLRRLTNHEPGVPREFLAALDREMLRAEMADFTSQPTLWQKAWNFFCRPD